MNKNSWLLLPLAALSALSGYLLSRASLTGRAGISLFYKEYRFLKVWWQGGLTVLAVLLAVTALNEWARRKSSPVHARLVHGFFLLAAMVGLYLTYADFRDTLSHRLLGSRFHLGAYLLWTGWILVTFFYLWRPARRKEEVDRRVDG